MTEKTFARIALDWKRHPASELRRHRVVPVGSALPYKPAENDRLLWRFIPLKSPSDVLNFVRDFGPLTAAGYDAEAGENVKLVLKFAELFRETLEWGEASTGLGSLLNAHGGNWNIGQATILLGTEPSTGTPRLYLRPECLLALLFLRLGQFMATPGPFGTCLHCGSYFPRGPKTDRRADAKFCSTKCQINFNSLKRTPREARHA